MGLGWAPGIFSPVASEDHPETRESAVEGKRNIHTRGGKGKESEMGEGKEEGRRMNKQVKGQYIG